MSNNFFFLRRTANDFHIFKFKISCLISFDQSAVPLGVSAWVLSFITCNLFLGSFADSLNTKRAPEFSSLTITLFIHRDQGALYISRLKLK